MDVESHIRAYGRVVVVGDDAADNAHNEDACGVEELLDGDSVQEVGGTGVVDSSDRLVPLGRLAVVHVGACSVIRMLSHAEEVEDLQLQSSCFRHAAYLEAYNSRLGGLRMDVVTGMEALVGVDSLVS